MKFSHLAHGLLAGFSLLAASGNSFALVAQNASNGTAVIEAESYSNSIAKRHSWRFTQPVGYEGKGAMIAGPLDRISHNVKFSSHSPRLDFPVSFSKTGTHYVWIRGIGSESSSNSVHVGLDGRAVSSSDRIELPVSRGFRWTRQTMDKTLASLTIRSKGVHTINLWMGESGVVVDKIVLTQDPNYAPDQLVNPVIKASKSAISGLTGLAVEPVENAPKVFMDETIKVFIDSSSLKNLAINSFSVSSSGSSIDGKVIKSGKSVQFVPSRQLQPNTAYMASIAGSVFVQSTGKTVPVNYKWRFTTINPNGSDILLFNTFDEERVGLYTAAALKNKWNSYPGTGVKQGRVSVVVDNAAVGDKALKLRYEGGKFGLNSGVQWRAALDSHDELYLAYAVKFPEGFDFVRGGKLPGFVGGVPLPYHKPSGSNFFIDRINFSALGKAIQYVYHLDQRNKAGDGMEWGIAGGERFFTRGEWHIVETRLKLNTPGKRDGVIQSWLNGELVLNQQNLRFRNTNKLKINQLFFTSFFGGADRTWATRKTEHSFFDNVVVSTKPITH